MNVVFLSPHFPPNFRSFCQALRRLGVNVLGVGDDDEQTLHADLRSALTEYYRVDRLEDYDQVLRAVGWLTHRHGRIDRVDSHNEHWLETEARLRTDFNIPGIGMGTIAAVKQKSRMKARFAAAGVATAPGEVVADRETARRVARELGFPLVAKPDKGVGAAATYKITDANSLERFLEEMPPVEYFLEAFVDGTIVTYDGLTDRHGHPVFETGHRYSEGIMEVVNHDRHVAYYSLRDLEEDVVTAGRQLLRVYDVRERFFHFEFFRCHADGQLLALEVNMRPPGGPTMDMFNYANDADLYQEWANVVVRNQYTASTDRPFHCCFLGRKRTIRYRHDREAVKARLGDMFLQELELPRIFSRAMGDTAFLFRSPSLAEVQAAIAFGHETI